MAYTRLHWVESETPLSADNMNNIEDGIEELKSQKVDKVSGKALSDQNYTAAEKTKLAGIETGAEVNVQPDWNQTNTSADDFIQNKPGNASSSSAGFMSASDKSKLDGVQAGAQVNRTYTAVTGKPTANASPGFGGTFTVSQVSQNANGQVAVTDRVITMPNSDASTSAHGLMSASDKTKLNGIAAGAQVNPGAATTSAAGLMSAADKTKLNGIETGATKNTAVATTSANGLMSSSDKTKLNGIETGATKTPRIWMQNSSGSLAAETADELKISFNAPFTVATEQEAVPGKTSTIKRIDMPNATTSQNGLMSAADKTKLNSVSGSANRTIIKTLELSLVGDVTVNSGATATLTFKHSLTNPSAVMSIILKNGSGNLLKSIAISGFAIDSEGCDVYVYNPTSNAITINKVGSAVYVVSLQVI